MIANRILEIILAICSLVIVPVQLVTTFLLSILINLSFGVLLFPLSIIWFVLFLCPLVGLSYLYEKISILKIPVAIIGIPFAVAGNAYAAFTPSMGDKEGRASKLLVTESFPYSWHYYKLTIGDSSVEFTNEFPNLLKFFDRINPKDKRWDYVYDLKKVNNIEPKYYVGKK